MNLNEIAKEIAKETNLYDSNRAMYLADEIS